MTKSNLASCKLAASLILTLTACVVGPDRAEFDDGKGDLGGRLVLLGFEQPEAVVWDGEAGDWYVSNLGGPPVLDGIDRDGDGFISRISGDG